jgi:acyl carrier protein
MDEEIRRVLADHAKLEENVDTLTEDDNLFEAGMTSHANVSVMLALEEAFDVEFPEAALKRSTFESIASIRRALTALQAVEAAS